MRAGAIGNRELGREKEGGRDLQVRERAEGGPRSWQRAGQIALEQAPAGASCHYVAQLVGQQGLVAALIMCRTEHAKLGLVPR